MKIISNDDVYIQGSDLEQILQNDKTFPLDMYYAIAKGMPHVKSLTKFIKIEGEKEKDFLKRNNMSANRYYHNRFKKDISKFIEK